MEINTNTYSTSTSTASTQAKKTDSKKTSNDSSIVKETAVPSDSYESSKNRTVTGLYTKPQNKLTDEQIQALRDVQTESNRKLIESLTSSLTIGQGANAFTAASLVNGMTFTSEFCSYTCEIPGLATNPADAKAAISEGGAYSVEAVADRIMGLATALAGDDQEMLAKMRSAVEKGFKEAGATFSQISGEKKLPQICQDTYKEVMKRFDKLQGKDQEETAADQKANNTQASIDSKDSSTSKTK